MKHTITEILILIFLVATSGCQPNKSFTVEELALIPQVQKMTIGTSSFKFKGSTQFIVENVDQQVIASDFTKLLEKASGWKHQIIIGGDKGKNQVFFKTEMVMGPEAYSIDVQPDRIEIKAAKPAGFFYATQTLRQLLPDKIELPQIPDSVEWLVPVVSISDGPAFKWRGFMLDVCRHFFPKESVFKLIDNLAMHKINTLHLHLVDDQGWRVEIKKYPKLTSVGAWRVDHEDKPWNARPKQEPGDSCTYGGFYTQEDIREIVAYAQTRFITVVPEIEMPAHVTSALASYPQFSCTGGPFTVPSGSVWPITDIYCAGKDSTFLFLEDILTEVMDMFPSKYIHIGGDEATKTEWEKCPDCRKRMKAEGYKKVDALQSYFTNRIEKFINSKGRILLGWDEIMEGELPAKAAVMSWRGMEKGIEAAKQGNDVVMTPTNFLYFDYYQGPVEQEPKAIGGYNPLSRVYSFNPVPEELDTEASSHIMGAQANLWTEYVPTFRHAEYMIFPRIAALSEVLWSPKEVRSWEDFSRRIQMFMKRYDSMGINYAKSAFCVTAKTEIDTAKNQFAVNLSGEFPNLEIRYTMDNSEPNNLSALYSSPVVIDKTTTLKAITFVNNIPVNKSISKTFNINKATFKPVNYLIPYSTEYMGLGKLTLVNGINGSTNYSDGEWQAWAGDNMNVVIDLQDTTEIHHISVGTIQNTGAWIFFPKKIDFYVSMDGLYYRKIAESLNIVDPLSDGIQLQKYSASFTPVNARYVKVYAHSIGKCPKGHVGAGQAAWLFADEISVE